jgi:hypothetical protein
MVETERAQRRRSGAALVKLLVWIVVGFGAYGGYKLMGVNAVENNIERAVDEMFGKVDHETSHDAIKHTIVRKLAVASIELDPENIRVETERLPGERRVEVVVEHPVQIRFLGSERILTADVHASRSIPVDEALLARQAERQQRVDAYWGEVREAMDDCREKWGRGNCTLSEVPGTDFGVVRDF